MQKIRVLLVDYQMLFVESLRTVLETRTDDTMVVGVAPDGANAVKIVGEQLPDVGTDGCPNAGDEWCGKY